MSMLCSSLPNVDRDGKRGLLQTEDELVMKHTLSERENELSSVRLVYPYPWFSPRFEYKDVILFPSALAQLLGARFEAVKGPVILGEESDEVSAVSRRLAMAVNMAVTIACFWYRCVFDRGNLRKEVTVLFNFNLLSSILAWFFAAAAPREHWLLIKADLNTNDALFRSRTASGRWKRSLIASMYRWSRSTIVVETKAALDLLQQFAVFGGVKAVLCRNGVETGIDTADLSTNRDIDVLIVTRFNSPAKAATRYLDLLADYRDELRVAIVGTGSIAAASTLKSNANLNIQCHDSLDHRQLVRMMCNAKVFLNLSAQESFCLSLLEAAEAGCRIITTDVGVAQDLAEFYAHLRIIEYDRQSLIDNVRHELQKENMMGLRPGFFSWHSVLRMDNLLQKIH